MWWFRYNIAFPLGIEVFPYLAIFFYNIAVFAEFFLRYCGVQSPPKSPLFTVMKRNLRPNTSLFFTPKEARMMFVDLRLIIRNYIGLTKRQP